MRVICISGKAGHGKDQVGDYMQKALEKRGERVLVTHFGDPVKFVCSSFFGWNGKKDEAGRAVLQYVGTNKVRGKFPGFWALFIAQILTVFKDDWDYVLIPDLRFPNELQTLQDYGFDVCAVRVERPCVNSNLNEKQQEHISEVAMDEYNFKHVIVNDSNLKELKRQAELLLDKFEWRD